MNSVVEPAPLLRSDLLAWLSLVMAIVFINSGNLLLDETSKSLGFSWELFFSLRFALSITFLGLAFVFYVRSLSRLPLAVAYPIMVGVSLIIVAVANHLLYGVILAPVQVLGMTLLFMGVVLISSTGRATSR